jgi:acetoacetyl-CoA synthetase
MPRGRWFEGARLNYAEAVLVGVPEDRPALIAVAEQQPPREISRAELRGQVGALAAALRELGVGPGDRCVPRISSVAVTSRVALPAVRP